MRVAPRCNIVPSGVRWRTWIRRNTDPNDAHAPVPLQPSIPRQCMPRVVRFATCRHTVCNMPSHSWQHHVVRHAAHTMPLGICQSEHAVSDTCCGAPERLGIAATACTKREPAAEKFLETHGQNPPRRFRTGTFPPHLRQDPAQPLPHLHQDWAHPSYICTGTGLTLRTSAP